MNDNCGSATTLAAEARAAVEYLAPELDGRFVVVLGTEVRSALGLPQAEPLSINRGSCHGAQFVWMAFPHPSGRNRWFNNAFNRARASAALDRVMRGVHYH